MLTQIVAYIVLACAAVDFVVLSLLLVAVWITHRGVRREAATKGEAVPSSAGDFRCLFVLLVVSLLALSGIGVFLLTL